MIRIRASRDRSPRTRTTSAVLGCGSMRWLARKGADILLKALVERDTGTSSPKTTRREHLYPLIDAIFVGVCSAADSFAHGGVSAEMVARSDSGQTEVRIAKRRH